MLGKGKGEIGTEHLFSQKIAQVLVEADQRAHSKPFSFLLGIWHLTLNIRHNLYTAHFLYMFAHPEECPAIENFTLYILLLYPNQQTKTNLYEINISKVHAMVDDLAKRA